MKITRTNLGLLAALAGSLTALAQSNGTPGTPDYSQFSQFIAEGNIFDPTRVPRIHNNGYQRPKTHRAQRNIGAPYVTLVGTMSYQKGLFAFFDSNNPDDKRILGVNDEVAGYKVAAITATNVILLGADKKETPMQVGEQLHQEGGRWYLTGVAPPPVSANPVATAIAPAASAGDSEDSSTSPTETPAVTPSPAIEGNAVLKRLMELRAKENQ